MTEPGGPGTSFTLREGEQNEWLEIRSIELNNKTVTAVLRKPCVRIRTVGAEVILSFGAHGFSRSADF